jgi:hypothetical protein
VTAKSTSKVERGVLRPSPQNSHTKWREAFSNAGFVYKVEEAFSNAGFVQQRIRECAIREYAG